MAPQVSDGTTLVPPSDTSAGLQDKQQSKSERSSSSRKENKVWWVNGAFVVFTHIVTLYTLLFVHPSQTWIYFFPIGLSIFYLFGITIGYHRLWSHQAYKATLPLRALLAIMGTGAFQGSIKWWVLRHRLHHRFTDTEEDPYSIKQGFFHAHIGWIFVKPKYTKLHLIDARDLDSDPVVVFQHKYFVPLALFFGFGVPAIAGYFTGEILSCVLYGGFLTRVMCWHLTFCINSFAHWVGDQEYETGVTARGSLLVALLTFGEGHHNYHHAFPVDYRNGIRWYHYDPSKWLIYISYLLGLAYDLKMSDEEEIRKSKVVVKEMAIQEEKSQLHWGPNDDELPSMHISEFEKLVKEEKRELMIIDGYVSDLVKFKTSHPGGEKILKAYYGKDATDRKSVV